MNEVPSEKPKVENKQRLRRKAAEAAFIRLIALGLLTLEVTVILGLIFQTPIQMAAYDQMRDAAIEYGPVDESFDSEAHFQLQTESEIVAQVMVSIEETGIWVDVDYQDPKKLDLSFQIDPAEGDKALLLNDWEEPELTLYAHPGEEGLKLGYHSEGGVEVCTNSRCWGTKGHIPITFEVKGQS